MQKGLAASERSTHQIFGGGYIFKWKDILLASLLLVGYRNLVLTHASLG